VPGAFRRIFRNPRGAWISSAATCPTEITIPTLRYSAIAVALSLAVGPIAGLGLSILLGLSGPARQAAILLASMPAAVVTTVLALEFDLDPSFATSAVFVSTMLSPFSLVLIIAYLQRF